MCGVDHAIDVALAPPGHMLNGETSLQHSQCLEAGCPRALLFVVGFCHGQRVLLDADVGIWCPKCGRRAPLNPIEVSV